MPTTPARLQLPSHPTPLLPCIKSVSRFFKGPFLLVPLATVFSAVARPVVPPGSQVWDGRPCDTQDSEELAETG